jgi:hypothetical protein
MSLNLCFTRFGESEILIKDISEAIEAIHDSFARHVMKSGFL